jgi:type II secretory pathway pseudopilin PulG
MKKVQLAQTTQLKQQLKKDEINMRSNNTKFSKQRGFSAIELGMVLAFIAIAVAGIMTYMAGEREKGKGQKLRTYHNAMIDNISAYYEPNFVYTGISTAVAVDGKLAPESMRRGSGATSTITTPYGSGTAVTVAADGTRTDLFSVEYDALPSEYCALDIKAMAERAVRVEISPAGGSTFTTIKDLTAATPVQFLQGTLATECAANSPTYKVRYTQG